MPWIIVVGDGKALEWVLESQQMAFRDAARVPHIEAGDRFAIYRTRGAFHSPTHDESQIVALGRFTSGVRQSSVTVNGVDYSRMCDLKIDSALDPRQGLPFRPLVDRLTFIRSKRGWATYMRRTLVRIDEDDFALLEREFEKHKR